MSYYFYPLRQAVAGSITIKQYPKYVLFEAPCPGTINLYPHGDMRNIGFLGSPFTSFTFPKKKYKLRGYGIDDLIGKALDFQGTYGPQFTSLVVLPKN